MSEDKVVKGWVSESFGKQLERLGCAVIGYPNPTKKQTVSVVVLPTEEYERLRGEDVEHPAYVRGVNDGFAMAEAHGIGMISREAVMATVADARNEDDPDYATSAERKAGWNAALDFVLASLGLTEET